MLHGSIPCTTTINLFDGSVVVNFDQVAVGIFKVDLFYAIDTNGGLLSRTRPVCILNLVFVEICNERVNIFDTEAKVIVPVALIFFFLTFDQVKMSGFADAEPGMLPVVKWLWYLLQAKNVFVELRACFEIRDVNADVI